MATNIMEDVNVKEKSKKFAGLTVTFFKIPSSFPPNCDSLDTMTDTTSNPYYKVNTALSKSNAPTCPQKNGSTSTD